MRHRYLIVALLVVIPVAMSWQVKGYDFVWDDEVNVAGNPYLNPVTIPNVIRFWQAPYERLYIPMSYTVWAVMAPFAGLKDGAGLNPAPFHIANVVFHVLSTLVVFAILATLVRRDWAACAGALLFALHPVQVEPIAWITGMKDILSGLLSLVAVWQYLTYSVTKISLAAPSNGKRGNSSANRKDAFNLERKARFHYTTATTAFLLALLAKPTAVVTPVIALLLDQWILRRRLRESAIALAGWLLAAIPIIVGTKLVQPESDLEFVAPLWARPLIAADAIAFYLYKLFLPMSLAPDYGRLPEWVIDRGWLYFQWVIPCAAAVLVWLAGRRRPWLVAAAGIFVIGMLPVSGLLPFSFQNVSTVADRYLYLSMLGPACAASGFLAERRNKWLVTGVCAVLAVLAIASALQVRVWKSDETLFRHTLTVNPKSWSAHYSLGRALAKQGRNNEAIEAFREAARLQPEFTNAHFSLGGLLTIRGEYGEAIAEYRQALKIAPNFVDARYGMGNALALSGDVDAGVEEYHQALKIDPNRGDIYFSLGNLLARKGSLVEAAESFSQALRIRPDFVAAHNSLGRVLAAQGDIVRATHHFREAVRIDPTFAEAHDSLALALTQQGKTEEAERHSREARRLKKLRFQQPRSH